MMSIEEIVSVAKTNSLRIPDIPSTQGLLPMVFACSAAAEFASEQECDAVAQGHCPADLKRFWQLTRTAKFFEDVTYRDWGLEIFSPEKAGQATRAFERDRPADRADGDLIVGRLIGDSDLLLLRTDPRASDFGTVIVAGPIDRRIDWDKVAQSFGEFLSRYIEARGDMYWTNKT